MDFSASTSDSVLGEPRLHQTVIRAARDSSNTWFNKLAMNRQKDDTLLRDTSPETEALLIQLLAKKSPAEKLQMVSKMNATVRSLAMSGLRERHPAESDLQLKVRLAELLYGSDIAKIIAERLNVEVQ